MILDRVDDVELPTSVLLGMLRVLEAHDGETLRKRRAALASPTRTPEPLTL